MTTPDEIPEPRLCGPCTEFPPRHPECQPIPWCSCYAELLIEAEETHDNPC